VSVTVLDLGKVVRLRVSADHKATERAIRQRMERYSVENGGEATLDRERDAVWKRINAILERDGLTADAVDAGDALLTARAVESLIELAAGIDWSHVNNVSDLFANGHVVPAARERAVRWLLERFAGTPDPFERDQLSLRIEENTLPAVAADLVDLIRNRRYGGSRAALLVALAKSKHPDAADVIASVLHEDGMAWAGVRALAKLKAKRHADKVRRCLRHPDSDVRREAKKALKALGAPVDAPPPPVHLVKGRARPPKGLLEWSRNLDMDELDPTLKALARCVHRGFGANEIAEVIGVVEAMRPEQTRAFRFPVTSARKSDELWVIVFMDDVDSPDLEIRAGPGLIEKLTRKVK